MLPPLLAALLITVVGFAPASGTRERPVPCAGKPCWKPPLVLRWNDVLSTAPDLGIAAGMYDIDMFDSSAATVAKIHAKGRRAICYISAGTRESWRPDARRFPRSVLGKPNGWPGERWLDIRRIDVLGPIMKRRLDRCRAKGFDGVEFDNVDGYANETGFPLSAADQLRYDGWLANRAHSRGLTAALKNDLDQVPDLLPYYDYAVNEQCFQYAECDALKPFVKAGKTVFNVEYALKPSAFCRRAKSMRLNSIKKRRTLGNAVTFCRS